MGNLENYTAKLPEIQAVKEEDIITPNNIPVDIYIREAENLYQWCQADKDLLIQAKLDWKIVEEILILAGALREAVSRWVTQRFTKPDSGKSWNEKSAEMFKLRSMLLHEFRFAYRHNTNVIGHINAIAGSQSTAALIQDLNDLSVLGKNSPAELNTINFDMSLLDKAALLGNEVAGLLASSTLEADYSAAKRIRDQAFTLLKKTVDEVCAFGQYLFWKDEARKRGYSSSYLRRIRKKRMKDEGKDKTNEQATTLDNGTAGNSE